MSESPLRSACRAAVARSRAARVPLAVLGGIAGLALAGGAPAHAAASCPISYGIHDDAKPNKLYLYYPSAADLAFPEFGLGQATSPAAAFDTSQLTDYSGTAAQLRDAVTDVVKDDYCEFNVQVRPTTTAPPTTFARRNVVAVGTDSNPSGFGIAENVDTGDPTAVDSARVWAGSYQSFMGGPGGALDGANGTLQRWARGIGGTAAHEAGHNYGLSHSHDSASAPGEDDRTRHVMPEGSALTDEQRVGYRRHFSDRTFSVLASNVGLSIQTMHNWDLTNPNAQTARRFRMEFLSPNATMNLSWAYTGSMSPWSTPTVSGPLGTATFKGQTYNRFRVEWSTGQNWSGGSPGQVPGGADFHVGATFSGVDFDDPDPIIITRSQLLDASGNALGLQPRLVGYDAGTLDAADGTLRLDFANVAGARRLQLEDVVVQQLPRVMSIDAMMRDTEPFDWTGDGIRPWPETTRTVLRRSKPLERKESLSVPVARLADGRHILERVTEDCDRGDMLHGPDAKCRAGMNVDLFPATTLYVRATVVDPRARTWDREKRVYRRGPARSRIYLQIAGRHPDLNRNEVDDAIDIATGTSPDRNGDGVPDEAQRERLP